MTSASSELGATSTQQLLESMTVSDVLRLMDSIDNPRALCMYLPIRVCCSMPPAGLSLSFLAGRLRREFESV